jgi:tetratricopeptide (TPR) repeat protein
MVVRDEEATLPHFLRHAKGLWDELCVVDTGSVDRTVEIVKMAGGRVQRILWHEDFSEARNACLEMASSDWVMVLDADELPSAALIQSARAQLVRQDRGACVVPFVSLEQDGSMCRVNHLRMFRRHSKLRYRFRVYEDITHVTELYLTKSHLGIGCLSGHIDHLGNTAERQQLKDIRRRDHKIIEATLNVNPLDLHGCYARIEHGVRWGGAHAAKPYLAAGIQALKAATAQERQSAQSMAERLVVSIARCIAAEDVGAAIDILDAWQERICARVHFFVARAELLASSERPAAAAADFERGLALAHTSFDVHNACIRPLLGLASIYQSQQDIKQAQALITKALGFDAKHPQALEALAFVSQMADGPKGVVSAAQDYIAQYGDCQELQAALIKHQTRVYPT